MLEQVYGELATKYVEYVPVEDEDEYHEARRSCAARSRPPHQRLGGFEAQ